MTISVIRPLPVIPAKAGIQEASVPGAAFVWIPAFAGMTGGEAGVMGRETRP